MRKACSVLPILGLIYGFGHTTQVAQAAEITRVATAFEDKNKFDLHFGLSYDYNFKQAAILREWNSGSNNRNRLVKDLLYKQQRHLITPSLEIGLYHDLSIYLAMPIVLADNRGYEFDQRADDCVFGEDVGSGGNEQATCVNKNNSTTLRDGILPRSGFDAGAGDPYSTFAGANSQAIFQGATRRGIDQFWVGIKKGILNQSKMSHMPNLVFALEGRFAVGRPMTFRRDIENKDIEGNQRVGRGIHELGAWMAISRRYRFLDPFFSAFWRQSIAASNTEFKNFSKYGHQDLVQPQSTAGVVFGAEIVPWERKAKAQKVSILLSGTAMLRYNGRGYSEVWELLSDSPALVGSNDPTRPCDRAASMQFADLNPGDPGYVDAGGSACARFNGITDLQDYATFGFNAAANFHLGKYARLMIGVDSRTDTRHFVTMADRGQAKGGADDDEVDPGTKEVNPVRRDVVDNVGRRYAVDDVLDLYAYARFLLTF